MKKKINLHLVSDSTGETASSVARAALSQFEEVETEEFLWSLIRTKSQMEKVIAAIEKTPGFVMFTLVDNILADILMQRCWELNLPCIPLLSRIIRELSTYLDIKMTAEPGKQHALDEEYFARVEAMNYTLAHDDGQAHWNLAEADIVLVGVSRTSKSPTSVYLANKGYKTANVPLVPSCPPPPELELLTKPLVVGLTINPDTLIQIRKNRLLSLKENSETSYVNIEEVKREVDESRKLFSRNRWPVIDVTRRSVEETAATIIQYYNQKIAMQNSKESST